jgi:hypothetical protein
LELFYEAALIVLRSVLRAPGLIGKVWLTRCERPYKIEFLGIGSGQQVGD